jgi:hypothetical protein
MRRIYLGVVVLSSDSMWGEEEGIIGRSVNGGVGLYSIMETRFIMCCNDQGSKNGGSLTRRVCTGEQEGK